MTDAMLDTLDLDPPAAPAVASLIWLHGLGADGHDFEPLIPQLASVARFGVRAVLPHAPVRPVTLNAGMRMRAWYDVTTLDFRAREDEAGIRASQRQIEALIGREIAAGIAPERIALAGFSQGGAMVLHTGLRYPRRLAGILALSTWLPLRDTLAAEAAPANRATPILMHHGSFDPVVPLKLALGSREFLEQQGYAVEWQTWPMQHAVCAEEVVAIDAWLGRVLGG